ncbi:replication initiator [Cellulosimicrobium sp. CpK407]|uniref:replication initiator n=1 Tax=Cellulosimicrobium sp. CpK407 TaxID=3229847 RepID=UPI003F3874C7
MGTPVTAEGTRARATRADLAALVEEIGLGLPCQRPIRRRGVDRSSGEPVEVLVRCGTRLRRSCPSCAALYKGDVRAVLFEGLRAAVEAGETVVLLTLTAPSFGRVHRVSKDEVWRPGGSSVVKCPCGRAHGPTDPVGGTPLDLDGYGYEGAVGFNYAAGRLWGRTAQEIGRRAGLVKWSESKQGYVARRPTYAGVAEWQGRGAIHLHVILRFPPSTSLDVYKDKRGRPRSRLVEAATRDAGVFTGAARSGERVTWGRQVRADVVRTEQSAFRTAGYLAKVLGYAAKDVGSDVLDDGAAGVRRVHHARLRAAADLLGMRVRAEGGGEESARRLSRAWGWRGNTARRSRDWSELTLTKARERRVEHARGERDEAAPDIAWLPGVWVEARDEWHDLLVAARRGLHAARVPT